MPISMSSIIVIRFRTYFPIISLSFLRNMPACYSSRYFKWLKYMREYTTVYFRSKEFLYPHLHFHNIYQMNGPFCWNFRLFFVDLMNFVQF